MITATIMDSAHHWMIYRGLRAYLGTWLNQYVQQQFKLWLKGKPRLCALCGGKVKRHEQSLDHIIPQSIAKELDLWPLLWDMRNFRLAHIRCNTKRRNRIDDLPHSIQQALERRRTQLLTLELAH